MRKRIGQGNWACVSHKQPTSSKDLLIVRVREDLGRHNKVTWLRPQDEIKKTKSYIFSYVYGPVCGSRAQARQQKFGTIKDLKLVKVTAGDHYWKSRRANQSSILDQALQSLPVRWPPYYVGTSFGFTNTVATTNTIAIGNIASATYGDSIAISNGAVAQSNNTVAIGYTNPSYTVSTTNLYSGSLPQATSWSYYPWNGLVQQAINDNPLTVDRSQPDPESIPQV